MDKIGNTKVKRYYYDEDGDEFISYVDENDIPEKYKEEFGKWMYGQTVPMVPGIKFAVYSWDYERWYNLKTKGIPTYFD